MPIIEALSLLSGILSHADSIGKIIAKATAENRKDLTADETAKIVSLLDQRDSDWRAARNNI